MSQSPITHYRALADQGAITKDPAQELAAEKLETLFHRIESAMAAPAQKRGGLRGLLGLGGSRGGKKSETDTRTDYTGLYMYGGVGRGKSMLMDLFFDAVSLSNKRRVHFHAFMLEVHGEFHRWRGMSVKERAAEWGSSFAKGDDPIPPLAARVAQQAQLLCFDEFQVTDVADAMILSRLFTALFDNGVWIVATSNRAPSELYLGGLNRPLFEPFIDLVYERLDVLHLDSPRDYRLDRLMGHPVYFHPLGEGADVEMDAVWNRLTDEARGEAQTLDVGGRSLFVPKSAHGVARLSFEELCARPLGAADYLALADNFETVMIDHIPAMTPARRNEAKRFVTLIDALYENHVRLVCSADASATALYPEGDGAFEFERTVSRLLEMQSEDYLIAKD